MRCVGKTRVTGGIDQHGKSGTRKSMEKKRDENVCLRERERERERERDLKREREKVGCDCHKWWTREQKIWFFLLRSNHDKIICFV